MYIIIIVVVYVMELGKLCIPVPGSVFGCLGEDCDDHDHVFYAFAAGAV